MIKTNTIKWRIFKYNLVVIILLIALTTVIFNFTVRVYIEKDILEQLKIIAIHTERAVLQDKPQKIFPEPRKMPPPKLDLTSENELLKYHFLLEKTFREPRTVLNANYILLDSEKKRITPFPEMYYFTSDDLLDQITEVVSKSIDFNSETYFNFHLSNIEYIAIIKPIVQKDLSNLRWIIIYSSLEKINQLQMIISIILFIILILSALIIIVFSSRLSRKISAPFSSLNKHIGEITARNFGTKIQLPVDDELQEFVNNINVMSEKLESYDKAQKTFLQNASHEFRTPLMSIQSYAEGIKYNIVDHNKAADIIIDESKRLTGLVADLLYLSRLDTIEENYCFNKLDLNDLIESCIKLSSGIALKSGITIDTHLVDKKIEIWGDEEKLSRAIRNILSNCIRYAENKIVIQSTIPYPQTLKLTIVDDGPGFDSNEIPNLFKRFYKGKKGILGLGLAITKNVIEKHNGKITAKNTETGALFIIELPLF